MVKNNLFFVFYINKFTKSFWMLSTSPPRTYEDLAFLKTKYKQISFDRNDYGIVKMQAALNCLLDFVGGTFIV
jgi:hypothetical protein